MAEILIGAQVRAGRFTPQGQTEEVEYNNLVLFTAQEFNPNDSAEHIGNRIIKDNFEAKIQNNPDNILKTFGRQITLADLRNHLGKPINVYLNRFNRVERVDLLEVDSFDDLVEMENASKKGGK